MNIIDIENVRKEYRYKDKEEGLKGAVKNLFQNKKKVKVALEDISIKMDEGEFVGVIGPNGAGKTTLMKIMSGIIRPTNGNVSVLGYNPFDKKDEYKKNFALVMGQKSQLWWDLPAMDSFLLNKAIYQIPEKEFKKTLDYLTSIFDVQKLLNQQVRLLSLGERMKMELIMSLLHNPKVIFLDEPTIGLDAIAQKNIRSFLSEINKEKGINIVLTSHYMEDIQRLCDRVVVINHGKAVYDGKLESLINEYSRNKLMTVTFASGTVPELEGVEWIKREDCRAKMKVKKEELNKIRQYLFDYYDVSDTNIEEEDIGDIIERIYK